MRLEDLTNEQSSMLEQFTELLLKWNKVYNLTAITDPQEILLKHHLDSLSIKPYLPRGVCLDVGCGAGFPSIPLAIVSPENQFTLLDSNGKKTRFVKHAISQLKLPHCTVEHARIEQFHTETAFAAILCRAFATLPDIVRMCDKVFTGQTLLLAMKGLLPKSELNELPADVMVDSIHSLAIPGLEAERHLVILRRRRLCGENIGDDQSERGRG